MKTKFAVFLLGLSLSASVGRAADVWIFAGQSNMKSGAQFSAFAKVVQQKSPKVQLKHIGDRRSGKPIEYWNAEGKAWQSLSSRIRAAAGEDRIAGFVWYQGESDANGIERVRKYESRLRDLIRRVRVVAGNVKLPAVIVQIAAARRSGKGEWETAWIREAQRRVAESDSNASLVTAVDLPIGDAVVHLDQNGHREIGRRQGLAALRLAYQRPQETAGPQVESVYRHPEQPNVAVIAFRDVKGGLKLSKGWRAGLTLVRSLKLPSSISRWPDPGELKLAARIQYARAAVVLDKTRLAVLFNKELKPGDRLSWCLTPHAAYGPFRRWNMPFGGISDATGIAPAAFAFVPVKEFTKDTPACPRVNFKTPKSPAKFDPSKPFQIAVNAIGGKAGYTLSPEDVAGAPEFRQRYWNPICKGRESNLFDARGLVTPISIQTNTWYAAKSSAGFETMNARMMASNNPHARHTVSGLSPKSKYDLVVYIDVPRGKSLQGWMGYRIAGARTSELIWLREPDSGSRGAPNFDFAGKFVRATAANKYTGNFLTFKDVQPDDAGTITIEAVVRKKDPRFKRVKPGLSGLQVIHRANQR